MTASHVKKKLSYPARWIQSAIANRINRVEEYLYQAAFKKKQNVKNVHRLRVASRQAMAAIQFLKEFFSPKQVTKTLQLLRVVRKIAGDARDIDVFLINHQEENGQDSSKLQKLICSFREKAKDPIVSLALELKRTGILHRRQNRLIESMKMDCVPKGKTEFQSWMRKRLLKTFDPVLQIKSSQLRELHHLHEFRVCCKKTRYTLELVSQFTDQSSLEKTLDSLAEIQERLGQINDCAVACERLKKWSKNCEKSKKELLVKLLVRERKKLKKEMNKSSRSPAHLLVQKLKRRLNACLDNLSSYESAAF